MRLPDMTVLSVVSQFNTKPFTDQTNAKLTKTLDTIRKDMAASRRPRYTTLSYCGICNMYMKDLTVKSGDRHCNTQKHLGELQRIFGIKEKLMPWNAVECEHCHYMYVFLT